jgi:integrase
MTSNRMSRTGVKSSSASLWNLSSTGLDSQSIGEKILVPEMSEPDWSPRLLNWNHFWTELMASISTDKNGLRCLRFVDPTGIRKAIYLGRMPKRQADQVKMHVEKLVSAAISRCAVADETSKWVSSLDDVLRNKLARVGLISSRESTTIEAFISSYIDGRHDAKTGTKVNWRKVKRQLLEYIDGSRSLASISKSEAKDFRQHLIAEGYAENTIRKVCSVVRQFFTDAVERELIVENPFNQRSIPTSTGGNPDRQAYISVETAESVLNACPDSQWRLLFALSRYAGLRCPSEHLALRWSDVNWERNRMTVRSCKTEHHEGKSQRVVPIFARLRPFLEAAFDEAEPGTEYVITRYRDTNTNLRTQLLRIINRAGVKAWPRLFNNLRASCETDLAKCHPIKAVCDWIGHSVKVAHQHYLQTTESDFELAVKPLPESMPDSDGIQPSGADIVSARHEKTLKPRCLPSKTVTEGWTRTPGKFPEPG